MAKLVVCKRSEKDSERERAWARKEKLAEGVDGKESTTEEKELKEQITLRCGKD